MSHQIYPPVAIVGNILKSFFQYRGLKLAPRSLAPDRETAASTGDTIVSDMERFHYVRIDALNERPRGARDWVVILVLSETGKYSLHGPDLRALIKGVEAEKPTKEGRLDELMIVAEDAFFGKKYVMDVVRERRHEARQGAFPRTGPSDQASAVAAGPDPEGLAPFYSVHKYHVFSHVVPEHVSVGRHTVLTDDEAKEFLREQRIQRSSLGVLYTSDAVAVWIGAREGQLVKVCYDSQTASVGYHYLRIERATDQ
jgi:DNA-directed RNA polymerase subunit H (RpoH/RPB5)